ncbi:conserved protein, unknown function [Hepatocystis sp. ex Piliocolobus tephrosceles]|nr:conserved protein, unknown function [Hepatocystis sp. ex Piliocolobus tephrosceles]
MTKFMVNLLDVTHGTRIGNFFFSTLIFFSNYLNFVCSVLKKVSNLFSLMNYKHISDHNIKQMNLKCLVKKDQPVNDFDIPGIDDISILNKSNYEDNGEATDEQSTDIDYFEEDDYNFVSILHVNFLDFKIFLCKYISMCVC